MSYQGGTSARPPLVTAAAVVLFVAGGLNLIGALLLFSAAGLGGIVIVLALLSLVIGAASIYAGVQIMQLREQGRTLGLGIAGVGAILALLAVIQGTVLQIIALLLYAFVIYALVTQASAFRRV
ncbi:MAG TPA: hypothetical protein VHH92_05985 [Actinomycetota bacterium]|jgi:hypothetical protein|nr:hypothetical protein [Actinomycetota bacterium]